MLDSGRTVSRQIKNTQKLSDSQKSARVLTPDSFHRGTSQHGRQSRTGARHSEPILGPSVLLTLPPHPTRTHTTQPPQQKHTKHCRASPPSSQQLQMHARTPTMHTTVHMRAQCNALRSCPPNPSQGALSCSPTPSRGPPRRSSTSDTGRCSVSSRRLGDCSGWFSSSDQQDELSPADEWIQKATTEQSGGAGAGAGQADVLTHSTTLDQSERCTVRCITLSPPARGHLQSQENTRVKGLDASAAAQLNRIVEQSAPQGAHRPLTWSCHRSVAGVETWSYLSAPSPPLPRPHRITV